MFFLFFLIWLTAALHFRHVSGVISLPGKLELSILLRTSKTLLISLITFFWIVFIISFIKSLNFLRAGTGFKGFYMSPVNSLEPDM